MWIKGVNSQYPLWEKKSQSKPESSSKGFGDELSAASGRSGRDAGKDGASDKGTIPENERLSTEEIMQMISTRKSEILEKVKKGETEPVIRIGAQAYTEKQWERMLESFDDSEKDIRDMIREALAELREKRAKGEQS